MKRKVLGAALILAAVFRVVTEIDGPSIFGSRIEGGTSRRIAEGDVVVILGARPIGGAQWNRIAPTWW